jgi:hypothetical protein
VVAIVLEIMLEKKKLKGTLKPFCPAAKKKRFATGAGGSWTTTGSKEKKDRSRFGYFLRHLKYVSFHCIYVWGGGVAVALLFNWDYIVATHLPCTIAQSSFWSLVRSLALGTALPIGINVVLPMWYFAFGMEEREGRRDMLPRDDKLVPVLDPAKIWPKTNHLVLLLQSFLPALSIAVMVVVVKASVRTPPLTPEDCG